MSPNVPDMSQVGRRLLDAWMRRAFWTCSPTWWATTRPLKAKVADGFGAHFQPPSEIFKKFQEELGITPPTEFSSRIACFGCVMFLCFFLGGPVSDQSLFADLWDAGSSRNFNQLRLLSQEQPWQNQFQRHGYRYRTLESSLDMAELW